MDACVSRALSHCTTLKVHDRNNFALKSNVYQFILLEFFGLKGNCVALASNSAASKARNACNPQAAIAERNLAQFRGAFSKNRIVNLKF